MNLLDELEDHGGHHQTYIDTQVIGNQEDFSDAETAEGPYKETQGSMLGMNFNIGGISKSLNGQDVSEVPDMPDMSILDKVRQRLYGGVTDCQETQRIEHSDRTDQHEELEGNGGHEIEKGEDLMQIAGESSGPTSTQNVHILPQLSVDDAEIVTQPAKNSDDTSTGRLFVSENDEPVRSHVMTKEERQLKIAQLAERKRQERLAKEKQQEELEADITHTTLTDEENDLNDHNESVVTSHVSDKQMKETDEFLNIKKREKIIQPEFKRKVVFTKDRLLSAFEEEGSEQSDIDNNSQDTAIKSSPVTSPLKVINKADPLAGNNDEEDENILSFLDSLHSPRQKPKQPHKNPIEIYAENLKQQLLSSPTKSTNNKVISLDSDLESGSNSESEIETQRMEIHDELKKIPQLSKEDKLSIKQRFSKKKMSAQTPVFASLPRLLRKIMSLEKNSNSTSFLGHLRKANINQLVSNKHKDPDHEILQELEKDEEVMGSLLEREMEKVRNIRRKEKLREKAALALAGKGISEDAEDAADENYDKEDYTDEEVPDSEMDSDFSSNYDSVDEDNEEEEKLEKEQLEHEENLDYNPFKAKRKARRMVVSDDDDDDGTKSAEESQRKRNDDSYMFGVVDERDNDDSLGIENDDYITTVNTQKLKAVFGTGASLTQAFENGTQVLNKKNNTENILDSLREVDSGEEQVEQQSVHEHGTEDIHNENYELFKNLKPRESIANTESQISEDINKSSIFHTELPSFQDIVESDIQYTQPDSISTQVDNPSQYDASTQIDDATQVVSHIEAANITDFETVDKEDEDEDINPSTLRTGRKLIRKNATLNKIMEDDEQSEDERSPEYIQQQIKLYEEKIRRKELKARRRQKELERMGIKNVVEGEAEESEDEWHGLGGVDGDLSDDQANSEDEKMIDNNFNIDLKNDDIRRKFMEEYQIKDQKELEKLLDDIKNHRLTKRVNGNGFDIELSDEEDELLAAYRKQKLKEQRARLMDNKKLHALAKNEKSKAFFDSIQDSTLIVNFDDGEDDLDGEMKEESNANAKDPFRSSDKEGKSDESEEDEIEKEPRKKTIRVEESFVQKQLSFLMKNGKEDYESEQRISNRQHGFDSSEDEIDDLQALKSKSLSNLHSGKRSESPTALEETLNKRTHDDSDTDVDEEFMPSLKKPSIIKSFRLSSSQQGIQVKDGKQFSGVTISKQYKTASGSKASITYLSKNKRNPIKSLKEKQIERSLNNAKNNNTKLFNSGGFDS
ncbi:uncharacterized protein AC631_00045 [Debaryomyces fabryi]|uniref:DNA replication checkpoint mediator MRC1 domain-containing protein n=1 Tax=Debaryomyces fabryi TaxID=58627 RepID=A0A0V1Q6N5_9ASCO|nr:uncharacterized protein AC631_00045 [Debaryomyces fabryi]KSA04174.1 hypothetical protein AC631_00045 [Debaryomyces fabryi]CUM46231.1 unnamed protein product [Debaryomyces fabryi]